MKMQIVFTLEEEAFDKQSVGSEVISIITGVYFTALMI